MNDLIKPENNDLIESQVQKITNFLKQLGLPSDNIIADYSEREIIGKNLPQYIENLGVGTKKDARYLSKFVVGAGFGLFDYALNSVWNEVVLSLRHKAITYGLDIFFDAAVGGSLREAFQKEKDLAGLKDVVLLETCKKLELISETTHKKLSHILDMRNDIGISHPTNYSINAFELLGWLQTCVQDVLNDKPSESAIQVKAFIDNLKNQDNVIEEATLKSIETPIKSLATHHCDSILKTIFGMYVSPNSSSVLRKNISLLSPIIWNCCKDEAKYKLGIALEGYNNNLHRDKHTHGITFFEACGGNRYRSPSEKMVALDGLSNELLDKHRGWDNFYHEVPVVEKIISYIQTSSDIPDEIANSIIKTVMMCRIGRGVRYCNGVSPSGRRYYDNFISVLGDVYAPHFMSILTDYDIQCKLVKPICRDQAKLMIGVMKSNIVNDRYKEALTYLEDNIQKNGRIVFDSNFKKISSTFLEW